MRHSNVFCPTCGRTVLIEETGYQDDVYLGEGECEVCGRLTKVVDESEVVGLDETEVRFT